MFTQPIANGFTRLGLGTLLCLMLWFLNGCQKVTPIESATEDQILLRANGADPADLDPHIATGVTENNIITALLEGLMRPEAKTLEPMPGMAATYEVSETGTRYTFQLREEAQWSNGDPVQAQDFVFSYQRMLAPAFGGEYAYMLFPLKNAEAYHKGELEDFTQVGVKALGPKTLQIDLKAATPYFLSLIMHYSWFPVHPPTILKFGQMETRGTRWTRPGNFVGNGPFVLNAWKVHDVISVKKNPLYYDATTVRLNEIRFYPIDNINTEERAFRSGQVHMTNSIPLNKINVYQEQQAEELNIHPYLGTYYYLLNTQKKPLDDKRVRKALAVAITRAAITENILKGGQKPAFHFTPPATAGYTSQAKVKEDFDLARTLLAEAGFPGGKGFPKLELLYNSSESHKLVAEAIQQMWKQELGIDIELVNQDWKVYLNTRKNRDFQIARAGWIGDYNDPNSFLQLLTTDSGNNHSGWSNSEFDALIKQASVTSDLEQRLALFQQAETILMDEVPVLPIYFYVSAYLVHPDVKGWHPNVLDWHPYQAVYLESSEDNAQALNHGARRDNKAGISNTQLPNKL